MISMRWNNLEQIVEALEATYPDEEIDDLRFEDLQDLVTTLNDFDDDPEKVNERILEAILDAWIDYRK